LMNVVPGGRTPPVEHDRLLELGYRIAIHPAAVFATATPAAGAVLQALREGRASPAGAIGVEEFFEVFGLSDWNGLGKRYDYKEQQ
jgi:2-methylisocitrate lyase-like PEP mutase family enzyme